MIGKEQTEYLQNAGFVLAFAWSYKSAPLLRLDEIAGSSCDIACVGYWASPYGLPDLISDSHPDQEGATTDNLVECIELLVASEDNMKRFPNSGVISIYVQDPAWQPVADKILETYPSQGVVEMPEFDTRLSPNHIINKEAAKARGWNYNIRTGVYEDADGGVVANKSGWKIRGN